MQTFISTCGKYVVMVLSYEHELKAPFLVRVRQRILPSVVASYECHFEIEPFKSGWWKQCTESVYNNF